jgi:hypothetical protein
MQHLDNEGGPNKYISPQKILNKQSISIYVIMHINPTQQVVGRDL